MSGVVSSTLPVSSGTIEVSCDIATDSRWLCPCVDEDIHGWLADSVVSQLIPPWDGMALLSSTAAIVTGRDEVEDQQASALQISKR
jgi:hypothetical protein